MSKKSKVLSTVEYEHMASELETMARVLRGHPEMNHHFAERLELLAKQMREDMARVYPNKN